MKRKNPEEQLHRAVARFLDVALPKDVRWSTFPSGGGGLVRGAKLKAAGLKPGWPDILILTPEGTWFGIELKAPNGRVSPDQRDFIAWSDYSACVCRSVEDVECALHNWGFDLRATLRRAA